MRMSCEDGGGCSVRGDTIRRSNVRSEDPMRMNTSKVSTRDRTMPIHRTRRDLSSPIRTMSHTTRCCTMRMNSARVNTSCSSSWDPTRDCTRDLPIRSSLHILYSARVR